MSRDGVELTFRQVSGLRPFVEADVNGYPVSMMLHSNAGFRAMVTHDVARGAGLRLGPVERADYGIEGVGRLASRGRTSAVATLRVGEDVAADVDIAVFDVPQDEPVDGMLGVGWLRGRDAVVDLGSGRLHFDAPGAGGMKLVWDSTWRAFVAETTVGSRPARFVVSTVAGVVLDARAAERLELPLGPVVDTDGGPTGTVVEVRRVEAPWAVTLGGRPRAVTSAVSWDVYAYGDRPRPTTDAVDGFLGCDLLVQERAVVDFGRGTLSLRP